MTLHTNIHQAHSTVGMTGSHVSAWQWEEHTDGNTMTHDQFVKPFKPVSSGTGLAWFQDDPRFHAKWKIMLFHQSQNFFTRRQFYSTSLT